MVLHRIGRKLKRFQTFNRLVVEVSVGHPDMIRKTFFINRKSVVVARDFNLIGLKIHNRMVPPVVSAFELVGTASQSQSQNLMTQTNAEDRENP